jgi:hypothetical protein
MVGIVAAGVSGVRAGREVGSRSHAVTRLPVANLGMLEYICIFVIFLTTSIGE